MDCIVRRSSALGRLQLNRAHVSTLILFYYSAHKSREYETKTSQAHDREIFCRFEPVESRWGFVARQLVSWQSWLVLFSWFLFTGVLFTLYSSHQLTQSSCFPEQLSQNYCQWLQNSTNLATIHQTRHNEIRVRPSAKWDGRAMAALTWRNRQTRRNVSGDGKVGNDLHFLHTLCNIWEYFWFQQSIFHFRYSRSTFLVFCMWHLLDSYLTDIFL